MTVLVAYDGSHPAELAVEYALDHHADETIVLLRVVELAGGSTGAGISLAKDLIRERESVVSTMTADELEELLESAGVEFEIETAVGSPAREVVRYAEENDVDHIVVGSHGREGVSRVLLGSVAEKIVRRAGVPVTVVR